MPKEPHGMQHKASNCSQGSIAKAVRIGKIINMKKEKKQEKEAREKHKTVPAS